MGQPFLGAECIVMITGPDGMIPTLVVNNDDGTFNVEYEPPNHSGKYKVTVRLNHQEIKDSPFIFTVEPLNVTKSYAEGPGLLDTYPQHEVKLFTVYAINNSDRPFLGAQCKVLVWRNKKINKKIIPVSITDDDN